MMFVRVDLAWKLSRFDLLLSSTFASGLSASGGPLAGVSPSHVDLERKWTHEKASVLAALVVAAITVIAGSAMAGGTPVKASVVYNSTVANGPPANIPSLGVEAYAFSEIGNAVTLAGSARHLTSVTVTLSSWACVSGSWFAGTCSTPAGSTFSQPITLNIYDSSGTQIATSTQSFAVSYRPSASSKCTGSNAGKWYSSGTKTCFNGLADDVTFSFSGVTLPNSIQYGIAYNTSHYGYSPLGDTAACNTTSAGCPYDSLNVALSNEATDVSAGTDTVPGTFLLDKVQSNAYSGYVPAVQFKAGS